MGVVVVAAGAGTRLGAGIPKAFVEIAGRTILDRALDGVEAACPGASVVAVVPPDRVDSCVAGRSGVTFVAGGAERSRSVANGLAALGDDVEVVLVHDAARCLTPPEVFARVIDAVRAGAAGAIPGLPVIDTIKVVDDRGVVTATPPRASLRAVQTPQGFDRAVLDEAHASGADATDDAALVEQLGRAIVVVDGHAAALKVTTPADLRAITHHL